MNTAEKAHHITNLQKAANSSFEELSTRRIPVLDDRLRALTHISVKQGEQLLNDIYTRRLLGLAIADASYIALGARKALIATGIDLVQIPVAIKASKPSLLALGRLPDPSLRILQQQWGQMYAKDMSTVPVQVQVVNIAPTPIVELTESAQSEINNYLRAGFGCPAKGAIMDRFFDRFVDVVLA